MTPASISNGIQYRKCRTDSSPTSAVGIGVWERLCRMVIGRRCCCTAASDQHKVIALLPYILIAQPCYQAGCRLVRMDGTEHLLRGPERRLARTDGGG